MAAINNADTQSWDHTQRMQDLKVAMVSTPDSVRRQYEQETADWERAELATAHE